MLDAEDELLKNEIVWHCFNADDKESLLNYIGDTFKIEEFNSSGSSEILCRECIANFESYGADWWCDILEYGKLEKFNAIRTILSMLFGNVFNGIGHHILSQDNDTLKTYCNYVRLNCRIYPDVLLGAYFFLAKIYLYDEGLFKYSAPFELIDGKIEIDWNHPKYNPNELDLATKKARKFANKGVALSKKIYTVEQLETFTTITMVNLNITGIYYPVIYDLYELKSNIEVCGEKIDSYWSPTFEKTTIKQKIDW